ncbi:MAG: hypothetical protein KDB01_19360, partial [Planctomycetaceae bacterium]|nr:hypothetical protein [Planctomycetaceae bacterium]
MNPRDEPVGEDIDRPVDTWGINQTGASHQWNVDERIQASLFSDGRFKSGFANYAGFFDNPTR